MEYPTLSFDIQTEIGDQIFDFGILLHQVLGLFARHICYLRLFLLRDDFDSEADRGGSEPLEVALQLVKASFLNPDQLSLVEYAESDY